jgi:CDP-diacylglycerol--serine O-phosphatidyltransferase
MFIAKWNKSVILSYVGLVFAIIGMYICVTTGNILHALSCLIVSGVCDLFDGKIARMCKRTKDEIKFGIQLDSLVDTASFVVFPIIILLTMGLTDWYQLPVLALFAICGIARLGHFNCLVEDSDKPVAFYTGLPVTAIAMILPLLYLFSYIIPSNIYPIVLTILIGVNALLNILTIKVKKPKGIAYPIFAIAAIVMLVLFLGVL